MLDARRRAEVKLKADAAKRGAPRLDEEDKLETTRTVALQTQAGQDR